MRGMLLLGGLLLVAAVMVAVGVGMIYMPAGVILGGLLLGAWAYLVVDLEGGDQGPAPAAVGVDEPVLTQAEVGGE